MVSGIRGKDDSRQAAYVLALVCYAVFDHVTVTPPNASQYKLDSTD